MPELRHDPVSGRVVVVAPERDARPHSSASLGGGAPSAPDCPFCPGHEHQTPPEVHRTGPGAADTPGWRVRVVPNLFPIVGGPHAAPGATGAHEVVILSPAHDRSFAMLDDDQAAEVLTVLRDRTRTHLEAGRRAVQVLVNHGREAGASLAHPHAQLVALDFVPPLVEATQARFAAAGRDLVAEQIDETETSPFAVRGGDAPTWCPPASGAPYEIRIAHRSPRAGFETATDDEIAAVAIATRDALRLLGAAVGDVAYNVILHSGPPGGPLAPGFHWYVEILPRLSVIAGFEQGTGLAVNVVAPETAATRIVAAAEGAS